MHRIVQKFFTTKAIKSFQILHFDLTIDNQTFDDTICIAHFTDEFTSYTWTYSLIDHKEKTLISMFKSLINQCDRIDMSINFMIRMIRNDQKTFIENKLNKWIQEQSIEWEWSSKYMSEQNEKFERFEALLIEKTRCIKEYAKLSEDLYSECYLAVIYWLNRTSIARLKWNSSLMTLQKCLNESLKWELFNLKVFDSKTYVFLKESQTSARSKKLKARAFIEYLIKYDSIHIFRVWNFEKWNVNDYRDVIFNEELFFDTYQTKNQIKKFVRKEHVEYYERSVQISQTNDILEELNNDEDEWVKKSVKEKIVKMLETIRKDSIQNADQSSIQDLNQSFEDDDHDQLFTLEKSSLHDTSELINIIIRQIDLKNAQRVHNLHISMKKSQSFDHSQKVKNLHTDMKESQSFDRQSFHSFRASQSFQSAISTTKLFTLSRKKRSLFESSRSFNESIRSLESRRHSENDVSRVEIRSSQSSLMNQVDEISTDQILLEIIDIFERLNIANKIEKVKEIVKEKDKTKKQFKSSKSSSSRSIESSDLNSANIIESKRNRRSNLKYTQLIYEEWMKISQFHVAFMIKMWTKKENEIKFSKLSKDAKYWSSRSHVSDFSSLSTHWRRMLKHSYAAQWQKAIQIEYNASNDKNTWIAVDKFEAQKVKIIFLKWVFIYKIDSDDFLLKFKTRIMIRKDLQMIDNAQNVYAATLTSKVFRMLMIMMIVYRLKTRQLNAVNAFLNAINDETIYCYMLDENKQSEKVFKMIRILYD